MEKLAVLLRENARRKNSHVIFSHDEGVTWSEPRELPLTLTGDRHTGKYGPDGRLMISFRCRSPKQSVQERPFEGDWVSWVGTWEDLYHGRPGQYFLLNKRIQKAMTPLIPEWRSYLMVPLSRPPTGIGQRAATLHSECSLKLSELDHLAK